MKKRRLLNLIVAVLLVVYSGTVPVGAIDLYIPERPDGGYDNLEYYAAAAAMISDYWEDDYIDTLVYSEEDGASLIDGEWYLPVSSFCEDAGVDYTKSGKSFTISSDEFTWECKINKKTSSLDGEKYKFKKKPVKKNGKYYINADELEETACFEVDESDDGVTVRKPYQLKRLIVEVRDGKKISPQAYGAVDSVVNDGTYILQFDTEKATKAAYEKLSSLKKVDYVEPDRLICMIEPADISGAGDISGAYGYGADWNVAMLGSDTLADRIASAGITGSVTVAVVDTGIDYTHEYLSDSVISKGYDFINNDYDAYDDNSHGTHVAGIIKNTVSGANVKLLPIKVLSGQGYGSSLAVANGIVYAAQSGADVINLSLGGVAYGTGHYEDNAVDKAIALGSVVVVAAGNDSSDTAGFCPAHNTNAICVAAIDSSYNRAYFSNYGNSVDVSAPGMYIYSTVPGNSYEYMSGTSMATPHVSGLAALIRLISPSASCSTVESILRGCAQDLGTAGFDVYYGYGVPYVADLEIGNNIAPTAAPTPTVTPITTPVPTSAPTPTAAPVPTLTPYPVPTLTPYPVPTLTPYPVPTLTPYPIITPYPTVAPTSAPIITQPVYSGDTSCSVSSSSSYSNGVSSASIKIKAGTGVKNVIISLSTGKKYEYTNDGSGINKTLTLSGGGVSAQIVAYDYYGYTVYSGSLSF